MAQIVGDLYPQASGSSSLGAEQLGSPDAGHSTDIRPFNHIHVNSGVFHDPIYGTSGIVRYDNVRGLEISLDGGIVFRRLVVDLQTAYDGGNEIGNATRPSLPGTVAGQISQLPIVAKVVTPGGGLQSGGSELDRASAALIIASGYTTTPNLRNTYHETGIGPGYIYIQGSGLASAKPGHFAIAAGGGGGLGNDFINMTTSGTFICNAVGSLTFTLTENPVGVFGDMTFSNLGAPNFKGGQIKFKPFNGSGQLEYRFGPYESWHQSNSSSSEFFPIPHSGHILQMILENAGGGPVSLQTAYNNGHTIVTTTGNPVSISGQASDCLSLSSLLYAAIAFSGVVAAPANARQLGDLWFAGHSLRPEHGSLANTFGNANFIGGGIPSFWYHAGNSGVINLRTGSGIVQFFNVASANFNEQGIYVPFTNTGQVVADKHFRAHNNSGIRVFQEGLYKAIYSVSVEKTAGELAQQANVFMHVTRDNGNAFNILGGESFAHVRNSTNLSQNTANGQAVFDMDAGELFNIFVQESDVPVAPNQIRIKARQANVILEFIGPKRGTEGRVQLS